MNNKFAKKMKNISKPKSILIQIMAVVVVAAATFFVQYFYKDNQRENLRNFIRSGNLEITVLDVGNADCIFIKNKDVTMLIDGGENNDENEICNFIRREGVSKIDYVIATHPDADHIGGFDEVVSSFEIGKFYMPILPEDLTPTSASYVGLLTALEENNVDVFEGLAGINFELGDLDIKFLSPLKGQVSTDNDYSIVIAITHGNMKFLFMGDAEKEVEAALIKSGIDLKSDFLKVGHHGSNTSSTNAFLNRVMPKYCVVTSGKNNRYNHPHLDAIERMEKVGAEIFRSDINGDIKVVSDGFKIEIIPENGRRLT